MFMQDYAKAAGQIYMKTLLKVCLILSIPISVIMLISFYVHYDNKIVEEDFRGLKLASLSFWRQSVSRTDYENTIFIVALAYNL